MTRFFFFFLVFFLVLSRTAADASTSRQQLPHSEDFLRSCEFNLDRLINCGAYVAVDRKFLFCRALDRCAASSVGNNWRIIKDRCCAIQSSNSVQADFHRKLMLSPVSVDRSLEQEKKLHGDFPETSKTIVAALPAAFLLCCALLCPCFRSRKKPLPEEPVLELIDKDYASSFDGNASSERKSGTSMKVPPSPLRVLPSPPRFLISPQVEKIGSVNLNISQIIKCTQNFSQSHVIGEGGFGTIYKAELPDGQMVAIKRARKEHFQALRTEFSSEVELLAKIEHRNLVRLLGFINKGNERIIITEYIPNGTLREHLDGEHGNILDFNQRLEIAIDVAHGLTYLHLYAEKPIIHRDVKSSNILLTESFRAKVSDFGFARIGATDEDQSHVLTKVKGTAGYLDPEYLRTHQLTPKSDVFSFGILLLEILSGRRPVELKRDVDERITIRWAFKKYTQGKMRDILDPLLEEVVHGEVLKRLFGLAFECAAPTRADRPTMKQAVETLWEIRKEYGIEQAR